jgi:hypothetical protein
MRDPNLRPEHGQTEPTVESMLLERLDSYCTCSRWSSTSCKRSSTSSTPTAPPRARPLSPPP